MSSKKPWPQKGQGRARHGTRRSPLFKGGSVIHGPRSHTSHFYMLPFFKRVYGLTSTLSVKLAQVRRAYKIWNWVLVSYQIVIYGSMYRLMLIMAETSVKINATSDPDVCIIMLHS